MHGDIIVMDERKDGDVSVSVCNLEESTVLDSEVVAGGRENLTQSVEDRSQYDKAEGSLSNEGASNSGEDVLAEVSGARDSVDGVCTTDIGARIAGGDEKLNSEEAHDSDGSHEAVSEKDLRCSDGKAEAPVGDESGASGVRVSGDQENMNGEEFNNRGGSQEAGSGRNLRCLDGKSEAADDELGSSEIRFSGGEENLNGEEIHAQGGSHEMCSEGDLRCSDVLGSNETRVSSGEEKLNCKEDDNCDLPGEANLERDLRCSDGKGEDGDGDESVPMGITVSGDEEKLNCEEVDNRDGSGDAGSERDLKCSDVVKNVGLGESRVSTGEHVVADMGSRKIRVSGDETPDGGTLVQESNRRDDQVVGGVIVNELPSENVGVTDDGFQNLESETRIVGSMEAGSSMSIETEPVLHVEDSAAVASKDDGSGSGLVMENLKGGNETVANDGEEAQDDGIEKGTVYSEDGETRVDIAKEDAIESQNDLGKAAHKCDEQGNRTGEISNPLIETAVADSLENVSDSVLQTHVNEEVAMVDNEEQGRKLDTGEEEHAHQDLEAQKTEVLGGDIEEVAMVDNEEQGSKTVAAAENTQQNVETKKLEVSGGEILDPRTGTPVAAPSDILEDSVSKTSVIEAVAVVEDDEQGGKSEADGEIGHKNLESQKLEVSGGEISNTIIETEVAASSGNVEHSVVKTCGTEEVAMMDNEEDLNSKHGSPIEVITSTSDGKQTLISEVVNAKPEPFDEQKRLIAVSGEVAATDEEDFMCSTIEGMETYNFDENLSFSLEELQGNIDSDDLCTENHYIVFADSKSPSELFFSDKDQWDHAGAHDITSFDDPTKGQGMEINVQVANHEWNLNRGDRIDGLNSVVDYNTPSDKKLMHEGSRDRNGETVNEIIGMEVMEGNNKVAFNSERVAEGSAEKSQIRNGGDISVRDSQGILDSKVQVDSLGEKEMQVGVGNTEVGGSVISHRPSYPLPLKDEGKFGVSDLVWGKVRSHPWWPGQIFDPSDASDKAMKYQKKDCFLVAYFGDRTFAWVDASQLKPFHSHFSQVEKQSNSDMFHTAVSSALEEVSRRIELGLAYPSLPNDVYNKIRFQSIENAGIKQESSVRDGFNESVSPHSFQTGKLVKYVKDLARAPFVGADRLELVVAKAHLLSFCRYQGYYQLPEFELCGGLVENDGEPLQSEERNHGTSLIKDDEQISETRKGSYHKRKHNLKDYSMYPNKKERSLSELMAGSFDPLDDDEFEYDGEENTSAKLVFPSSSKKRKPGDSVGDDSSQDGRKTISLAKVSVTAPNIPKPSFKIGECIKRVASQMTGSPSILKNNTERPQKLDGNGYDVSYEKFENGEGKKMTNLPTDYSSLDGLLSQLRLAARDPKKEVSLLNVIVSFFSDFRNSVVLDRTSAEKTGGKRRKMAHSITGSPEAFEFEDTNDTYWTDRVIQNGAEEQQEPVSGNNKNNNNSSGAACKVVPVDLGKHVQKSRRSYTRKQQTDNNNSDAGPAKPPGYISENAPAELILNFSEVGMVPSEMNLNKMFKRFGPLKESETEVDRESSRARVVFKKCRDAEVAYSSAPKFNIFGPMAVNYQLNYSISVPFKTSPTATTIGEEFTV